MTKLLMALAAVIALTPTWAPAQTADVKENEINEVIVTAQRRGERLQDVPIAISAFTAATLERSQIETTVDLQQRTPGLVVTTNASYGQPYIRGVGSEFIQPGTDPSVAVFVDGVYQARPNAAITQFSDVERVEVLKGPQGTLYGRNATAGALAIYTSDPENRLSGSVDGLYGNRDRLRVRGMVNIPLSDTVALRMSGLVLRSDGFTRNLLTGDFVDPEKFWSSRAKLLVEPSDTVKIVLSGEFSRDQGTNTVNIKVNDDPSLPLPVRDLAPLLGFPLPNLPSDPRLVRYDHDTVHDVKTRRVGATVDVDLGGVKVHSITGYTSLDNDLLEELDGTELDFLWDRVADTSRVFSQEVQLLSNDSGPLTWVLGGYYLHEHATQDYPIYLPLLFGQLTWNSGIRTDAYAAFGQTTYKLGRLELTGGLRYSYEHKRAEFLQTLDDNAGLLTGAVGSYLTPAAPRASYSAVTPRFAARFAFTPDVSVYISATRGFKSGGFNLQNTGEKFNPETIWSYEVGLKSAWLERRFTANMAAFIYDYKDLQVNQYSGLAALITNAANARIKGLELELVARPVGGLSLDASLALLDARFRDYVTSNPNLPGAPEVNLTGYQMPRAPRSTINAGAEYDLKVPGMGDFILRGEMQRQANIYFDQFETPAVRQPGYTLINARLSFESEDGRWHAALFGRNLGNELYRASVVRADSFFGTLDIFGPPRTYGVELGRSFGAGL